MMINSLFIGLFAMICAYHVSTASVHYYRFCKNMINFNDFNESWFLLFFRPNCTPSDSSMFSNACIFKCVENLYDKNHCNVCALNTHPIKMNDILASLMPYLFLRYDEGKESFVSLPSCSGKNKFMIYKV